MKGKYGLMLAIFLIGFLLNLLWENVQAPLYEGYNSFWGHFMLCFWASLVDALVILLLYGLLAAWYRDFFWVEHLNWKAAALLVLSGALIAVGFELWAFETGTWAYSEKMPVIPFLQTGLAPLLQMMLLPLLTLCLVKRLIKSGYLNKKTSHDG